MHYRNSWATQYQYILEYKVLPLPEAAYGEAPAETHEEDDEADEEQETETQQCDPAT